MRDGAFRWVILAACALAAAVNALYLLGVWPDRRVTSLGLGLLLACYAALLLSRRRGYQRAPAPDTPLQRARGTLTAILAALWAITYGLTLFWRI